MKAKILLGVIASTCILGTAPGCDGDGSEDRRNAQIPTPTPGAEEPNGPRDIDVARPAFQAKSAIQLAKSIEACVGTDAIWVTPGMIATPENPAGFLTTDFVNDDHIVEVQTSLFDGTADSLRTGVRVDQVGLEYLTALKNVANVVGSRCASDDVFSPEKCVCETEPEARAMLTRCLAAVADPSTPEFAELTREFHAVCQQSRAKAIASMIASLAFAKVP
jgi:hypothetical protein